MRRLPARLVLLATVVAGASAAPCAVAAAPGDVKVIGLGVRGPGSGIAATDMNDAGWVVGSIAGTTVTAAPRIVIWRNRKVTSLGTGDPRAVGSSVPQPQIAGDGSVVLKVKLPYATPCGYSCAATVRWDGTRWSVVDVPTDEGGVVRLAESGDMIGQFAYRNPASGNFAYAKTWLARDGGRWQQLTDAGDGIEEGILSTSHSGYVLARRSVGKPIVSTFILRRPPTYDAVTLPSGYDWRTVLADGRVVGFENGDATPRVWTSGGGVAVYVTPSPVEAQGARVLANETPQVAGSTVFRAWLWSGAKHVELDAWRPAGAAWAKLHLVTGRRLTPGGELLVDGRTDDGQLESVVMLRRVVLGGSVVGAGPRGRRPSASATVVATGARGRYTAAVGARGTFRMELPPGRYTLSVLARTGCLLRGTRCAATSVVTMTKALTVRLLADPAGTHLALDIGNGTVLAVRSGKVTIPVRCAVAPCRGTVAVRTTGGAAIGSATVSLAAGRRASVAVRVGTRRGAARVVATASKHSATATVSLR